MTHVRDTRAALAILALLVGSFAPAHAHAQFRWRALSTPGYAAAGMAVAAGPAFEASSIGSGVAVFTVGLAGGAVVGWIIGDKAEKHLERDEPLSHGHKNAVRAGTVMTGAGVGALTSVLVINSSSEAVDEGENDAAIFAGFVAGGAAVGVLTQVLLDSRLDAQPVQARLGLGPEGGPALVLSFGF